MIRVNNNFAKAMEFTSFRKKETVTDDELINVVLKFETALTRQSGVIFHCLVRNFRNEYANVLFVSELDDLKKLAQNVMSLSEAQDFFKLIDAQSINITFHKILKDDFQAPHHFSCIECSAFSLKKENESQSY